MPEARNPQPRLDPRQPLVLDTRELSRRAGSSRRVRLVTAAPADFGIPLIGVPAGTELTLELLLEAVMEGVLVSGTVRGRTAGECVRCLDAVERELEVDFQELYVYPESEAGDDEASRLDHDLLGLEPTLRDAVVLALPFRPVCREDCPGLCPDCGQRMADEPGHRHEQIDPRWAALAAFTTDDAAGSARSRPEKE